MCVWNCRCSKALKPHVYNSEAYAPGLWKDEIYLSCFRVKMFIQIVIDI
jgi:hypothetical protein